MKKSILFLSAVLLSAALFAQPPAGDANVGDAYGAKVTTEKAVKPKVLKSALDKGTPVVVGENVVIEGKVLEVCPKKGCWVKLELPNKTVATVKMKDYGFFVPLNLEGKNIRVEGKAEVTAASVAELKHLAEDANKSQEEIDAITQPKKELKILANGIEVIK